MAINARAVAMRATRFSIVALRPASSSSVIVVGYALFYAGLITLPLPHRRFAAHAAFCFRSSVFFS
jgi:hypothetical protein